MNDGQGNDDGGKSGKRETPVLGNSNVSCDNDLRDPFACPSTVSRNGARSEESGINQEIEKR